MEIYTHCKICRFKNQQRYHRYKKNEYCLECFKINIFKKASFGLLSNIKKIACANHKIDKMINLNNIKRSCLICVDEGIFKLASFGLLSDKKKTHCIKHKTDEMINLVDIKKGCIICYEKGIFKIACFGLLSDKKKISCAEHKTDKMIDLAHIKNRCIICNKEGILKRASFGLLSNKKITHCSNHKSNKMINLVDIKRYCITCLDKSIFKKACFGLLSNKKATHCSNHKSDEMINLNIKNNCFTCSNEGVLKKASFGLFFDKIKTHCVKHKTEEMINLVNHKRCCIICLDEKIFKQACFGLLSNKKTTHCSDHKSDEMIDLVNRKNNCLTCSEEGVLKQASFGFLLNKKRTHCSSHKTDEMIDLVHNKTGCIICKEKNIFKHSSYGFLFEKKTHCGIHKKPNMYKFNNPTCSECTSKPFYGDSKLDDIPIRCEKHKLDTDSDMISRKCDLCGDEYFIPSTETKCRGCLGFIVRKHSKRGIKEKKIADLLNSLSSTLGKPIHDKKVKGGCSKKRPDFYYSDFNPCFSLIIEVDENQHSSYTCGIQAEMQRIISIYENDNGGFPLCIVRFNPDAYYYKEKATKAYKGREDVLKQVICGLKNRTSFDHKIGVIYLYYDNFNTITGIKVEPFNYEYEKGKLIIDHKHPLSIKKQHVYNL